MAKVRMAVGGGAFESCLNFQKVQKNQKFIQKNVRAFSVAEAFIALGIGAVVLGMSAPMITKQIKHNDMNAVQFSVINREIEKVKSVVPKGVIVMWSGSAIPTGWALCDGTNGTPDLRNRFIVGAGDEYAIGANGGDKEVALTIEQMPKHDHEVMEYSGPWKSGVINYNAHIAAGTNGWSSSYTSFTGGQTDGTTKPHENRPPYYALAYIMKIK